MRIDKFLQLSGIIPRRTRAQEVCSRGYVVLNGRTAKQSASVSVGDRLEVRLGRRRSVYEVLLLPSRPMPKDRRHEAARLLESQTVSDLD
jgi:ribosomal 50S subunit-recycling heat shock protein